MRRRITFLILILFSVQLSYGQRALVKYGNRQFEQLNYEGSLLAFKKAYASEKEYELAKKIAFTHQLRAEYDSASIWYLEALTFAESNQTDIENLLKVTYQTGDFDAFELMKDTLAVNEEGYLSDMMIMLTSFESPRRFRISPLDQYNTKFSEFGYTTDFEGNKYFTSDRREEAVKKKDEIKVKSVRFDLGKSFNKEIDEITGRDYFSIYRVTDDRLDELKSPVPNTYHFTDITFLRNAPVAFYTITRDIKARGKTDVTINPEIFFSTVNTRNGNLTDYDPLPVNNNLSYAVMSPYVDEANKRVYFSSNMPGGKGGFDLYYVTYSENFTFSEPVNLGDNINSEGDEKYPYVEADYLYFSSNGHAGLGGLDIFKSQLAGEAFSAVQNLGLPFNSPQDDFAYERQGRDILLASNRADGQGYDDLYKVELAFRRFTATVLNCNTNEPISNFKISLQNPEGELLTTMEGEGDNVFELDYEQDYKVTISGEGFFPKEVPAIKVDADSDEDLDITYSLTPIPYKLNVFSDKIYFDLDESDIRIEARAALNEVVELLKDNDFVNLKIKAHTDVRATDEYNLALSERRAQAVSEYLAAQGVSPDRVKLEWVGESEPAVECTPENPCSELNHQINRRAELIVEAFPDEKVNYEVPAQLGDVALCSTEEIAEKIAGKALFRLPTIYFDFDKFKLNIHSQVALEDVHNILSENESLRLSIEGHTDLKGPALYNQKLSERRALAVRNYLINKGISEDRLTYKWFGKSAPLYTCESGDCTEEQHQLNRRTELRIIEAEDK
ncbi:OmpA family protein [Penaeicola halotolerans]|uniref:OmpA family protein n=1 Tax=Penaeicola halotolerans TaxID=2793196 RepID=UPI001CF854C0|nr:OmpA family protein [Penaeicola halotolerans]